MIIKEIKELICDDLIKEFFNLDGRIIHTYLPYSYKGYIVIKRGTPVKEKSGERFFYYARYDILHFDKPLKKGLKENKFYLATEYVKMSDREVKKLCYQNFRCP